MNHNKKSYFIPALSASAEIPLRYVYGFCAFWVTVAGLELGQDVLSAALNGTPLRVMESLSYKLFWLFFIPLSLALAYGLPKGRARFTAFGYVASSAALVVLLTAIHLVVFLRSCLGSPT